MKNLIWKRFLINCLFLILITGCTTATLETAVTEAPKLENTPIPASCEEVEGNCLKLTFYGNSCIYEGPEYLENRHVTYFFYQ